MCNCGYHSPDEVAAAEPPPLPPPQDGPDAGDQDEPDPQPPSTGHTPVYSPTRDVSSEEEDPEDQEGGAWVDYEGHCVYRSNDRLHDITAENVRERARQGVEAVLAAGKLEAIAASEGAHYGGWVDHGKGWIEWIDHSERNDHFLDREGNPPDGGPRIRKAEACPRGPRAARQSGDRRRGRPRPYRGSTGATMAQWTAVAAAVGIPADAYQFCSPDNVSTNYPVWSLQS